TFIVGQTRRGPLAGHGAVSLKLAADPGSAAVPEAAVTSTTMSARRFMTPYFVPEGRGSLEPPRVSAFRRGFSRAEHDAGCASESACRRRDEVRRGRPPRAAESHTVVG